MALRRTHKTRFLGGVLSGLARALRLSPWLVRLIFLALLLIRAFTLPLLILYALAWMFLPQDEDALPVLPPPPRSPGRLTRSRRVRVVSGLCGGLAEYYRLDPLWIRLGVSALCLLTLGWGVVLYALATLSVPQEGL